MQISCLLFNNVHWFLDWLKLLRKDLDKKKSFLLKQSSAPAFTISNGMEDLSNFICNEILDVFFNLSSATLLTTTSAVEIVSSQPHNDVFRVQHLLLCAHLPHRLNHITCTACVSQSSYYTPEHDHSVVQSGRGQTYTLDCVTYFYNHCHCFRSIIIY